MVKDKVLANKMAKRLASTAHCLLKGQEMVIGTQECNDLNLGVAKFLSQKLATFGDDFFEAAIIQRSQYQSYHFHQRE